MNKRLIFIILLPIFLLILGCQNKEVDNYTGEDKLMNIIDINDNIKSIKIDQLSGTFKLEDIVDIPFQRALVMGEMGEVDYIEDGYFKRDKDSLYYIGKDKEIENIVGVVIDPPETSIKDAYYDMERYLEDDKVLFILLDGFGYHQYEYARENGFLSFLEEFEARKALSVYKPVTNAGLAAIITGKSPEENGVYSRKQRELNVDSIFKVAKDLNKNIAYIEGNIGILDTEVEPILNLDKNKDGYTDDEVYMSTLKAIEEGKDFVFTHFHGIDDAGHTFGPLAVETMERIKLIDSYIQNILSHWDGITIITADHGMHSIDEAGDHGDFRYEDLIVPYIIIK